MAGIPLAVGIEFKDDSVFPIVVNNVGYIHAPYPELFAKVPEEVSCNVELLPCKVGGDFLPQSLHRVTTKLSRSTVIRWCR